MPVSNIIKREQPCLCVTGLVTQGQEPGIIIHEPTEPAYPENWGYTAWPVFGNDVAMTSDNTPQNVLVVEDDAFIRKRLVEAVSVHPNLSVCGETAYCEDALKMLAGLRPAVLLTDLGLPDGDGIDLIREASRLGDIESIVITVFGDEKHMMAAIEAGASGYLLKNSDIEAIGDSILEMLEGGSPMSPSIARALIKRFQPQSPSPKPLEHELTGRELEVLGLIARGLNYNEISTALNISYHTVATHVKRIYRKLQVNSRSEAVFEAEQMGLIRLRE